MYNDNFVEKDKLISIDFVAVIQKPHFLSVNSYTQLMLCTLLYLYVPT